MKELGKSGLKEVMGTSTVYENGEGGMIDDSDESEGLGGGEPCYGNMWVVKGILRGFELMLGLRVHFLKSSFFGFNVEEGFMASASNFLHCSLSRVSFWYLGISIGVSPKRVSMYEYVVSSFRMWIRSWKGRYLFLG